VTTPPPANPVIFYDGVCGLCSRLVRFTLRRDRARVHRYSALQSAFARSTLIAHGRDPDDLDSVYVLTTEGVLMKKSRAILKILEGLGGAWRMAAMAARVVPAFIADGIYDLVAANRYRIWGRFDACEVPSPETRALFIEG
jgi:predicted DCC family thiol-disulfide oxidoreductase YuxK